MTARVRLSLLLAAGALALAIGLLSLTGTLRSLPTAAPAEAAATDIATSTAGVYVSLRVINAALSAAQEVEIGGSMVAEVGVQPLKVLEPVDDTVERVADVVFAVAAGAALATVGLAPVSALGLVLLGCGLLGVAAQQGRPTLVPIAPVCQRAVRMGAVVGLIVPLMFAAGVWLGERVTAVPWQAAMAELDRVTQEAEVLIGAGAVAQIEDAATPVAEPEGGFFAPFNAWIREGFDTVEDGMEAVARYRDAAGVFLSEADALFSATMTIIGVYALRMLVLPLVLMWGAWSLLRQTF